MASIKDINAGDSRSGVPQAAPDFTFPEVLFGDNPYFEFAYKKSERLAIALHLVTNFIHEKEPLRKTLREKSLKFLSDISFLRTDGHSRELLRTGFLIQHVLELIGLLEVAYAAGYISQMNYSVLKKEYSALGDFIKTRGEELTAKGEQFSDKFFDAPEVQQRLKTEQHAQVAAAIAAREFELSKKGVSKGQTRQDSQRQNQQRPPVVRTLAVKRDGGTQAKHRARRDAILRLLENKPAITIKDITLIITDCSEKTLQRELLSMVSEGILKKEGERRWSTYSRAT